MFHDDPLILLCAGNGQIDSGLAARIDIVTVVLFANVFGDRPVAMPNQGAGRCPGCGERFGVGHGRVDRVPDQSLIDGTIGERYNYLAATKGKDYAFIYDYTGRNFEINMGKIKGAKVKASWYSPRNGRKTLIRILDNKGVMKFDPPGEEKEGNDWVLILESI